MECSGEPEEGDDSGEFVQDEEGGDVGERGVGERGGVSVQEFGEAAVEAVDARGGGGWWRWLGCEAARAEGGGAYSTLRCAQKGALQHCDRCWAGLVAQAGSMVGGSVGVLR